MSIARRFSAVRVAVSAIAAALFVFVAATPANAFIVWSLREHQPNVPNGGRVNAIAVSPADENHIIVASETGGLFRSLDRGATWRHLDNFPLYAMGSVAYVPAAPGVVLATAADAFSAANQGGIWRSVDGGVVWTRVAEPPAPAGVTARYSAGDIAIAPDTNRIYVATSWGVAISDDDGASWTLKTPFSGLPAFSVAAQTGGVVIAGSNFFGISRSTDHGATWSGPIVSAGGIRDMHALAASPVAADTFYAVNAATQLFVSTDAGAGWTPVASAPAGGGSCGGIGFLKAVNSTAGPAGGPSAPGLRLYFGNRCGMYRLIPAATSPGRYDYSGAWFSAAMDHGDTRDLAFTNGAIVDPLLLGTDGGLHRTADRGASWTFTGGGVGGYNALQITEVKGQKIGAARYDLYFGTQDNNNWASGDLGVTWPVSQCCEGFFFEMQKAVATPADSQISWVSCFGCASYVSGALMGGAAGWTNPAGAVVGNPSILLKNFHVQGVNADAGFAKGMAYTKTLGASWAQYATFAEDRRDLPKLTQRRVRSSIRAPRFAPVQYQAIRTGFDAARNFEINTLVRVSKSASADTGFVAYPAMSGFGGLGITPTMFAWYQVFGVDPTNWRRLIAPDVVNEKMMKSEDGGETWTEVPGLTALVTDGGRFNFRASIFPLASTVGFFGGDPNYVAVGTFQNGLMLSTDGGANWSKVPGSEAAPYITSIEWRTPTDAFVSTYGRGLWRLEGRIWIPRLDDLRMCFGLNCIIRYIDRGDPPPFRDPRGVLVFGGRVLDYRAENGRLAEIFVTPGSSVGVLGKSEEARSVKVVERAKSPRAGSSRLLAALREASGAQMVGLALDEKGAVVGHIFANGLLSVSDAPPQSEDAMPVDEDDPKGQARSPIEGKPYVSLSARAGGSGEAIDPGADIILAGQNFEPGSTLEVVLDGRSVGKAAVLKDGSFRVEMKGPDELGFHTLVLRQAETQKVVDGVHFVVRHQDRPNEDKERQGRPEPQ